MDYDMFFFQLSALQSTKETFQVLSTRSKKIIIKENGVVLEYNLFKGSFGSLFKNVKNDAIKFLKSNKNPPFFEIPKTNEFIFLNESIDSKGVFICIDLKSAYWTAAKFFLSTKTYLAGLKVPKKFRLISLGALAKATTIEYYVKGELIKIDYKVNNYAPFFYSCQKKISLIMENLMELGGVGFWVDCIFCYDSKDIELFLKDSGFEYSKKSKEYIYYVSEKKLIIENKEYNYPK